MARELHVRGETVELADDVVNHAKEVFADNLGLKIIRNPDTRELKKILRRVDQVVPAPGMAENHRLIAAAKKFGVKIFSELELAYQFEQLSKMPREMVGITGSNGKSTTTLMASAIINMAGHRSLAVGNIGTPFISLLGSEAQVFAVECSSFRLAYTEQFRTRASAWLNFAPNHLDWHNDLASYQNAKSKIWGGTRASDIAVVPEDSDKLLRIARSATARVVTFGIDRGDYNAINGQLSSPHGQIMNLREMRRSYPHDVTNALAAAAVCIEAGLAEPQHVGQALTVFEHAQHRIQFIAERDGVCWFNDSKATSPHAAEAAIRSFNKVVLIAGGQNKGLDLTPLASQPNRIRAVVAVGATAVEIERVFSNVCVVNRAEKLPEAVVAANGLAQDGDVVLLSPGCTSFDRYTNYIERGEHFARLVHELSSISRGTDEVK